MKIFIYSVIAFVVIAVTLGIVLVGSPGSERARQFDDRRVNDLTNLQSQVVSYWQRMGTLPATQDALRDEIGGFVAPADPETGSLYEYATSGPQSFSLCATFAQPSSGAASSVNAPMPAVPAGGRPGTDLLNWNWDHAPGRVCFERTIDPALYPPLKTPAASGGCVITGCSSQVCSEKETITTCEWTPAYACYRQYSTCGRLPSGACGWAGTPALTQCLSDSKSAVPVTVPQ